MLQRILAYDFDFWRHTQLIAPICIVMMFINENLF